MSSWKANELLRDCLERYAAARGGSATPDEVDALITQLAPLTKAVARCEKNTDRLVKRAGKKARASRKAMVKQLKGLKRAQKAHWDYAMKVNRITKVRNNPSRLGYANGVRFEPSYSSYPVWHRPGGMPHAKEN